MKSEVVFFSTRPAANTIKLPQTSYRPPHGIWQAEGAYGQLVRGELFGKFGTHSRPEM